MKLPIVLILIQVKSSHFFLSHRGLIGLYFSLSFTSSY